VTVRSSPVAAVARTVTRPVTEAPNQPEFNLMCTPVTDASGQFTRSHGHGVSPSHESRRRSDTPAPGGH
jgi:hypothetical protein